MLPYSYLTMDHNENETLICIAGEIKAVGEGHYRGRVLHFGSAEEHDMTQAKDYFTPSTDFGGTKSVGVYFEHGMDPVIGTKRVGAGTIDFDDDGAWLDFHVDRADRYGKLANDFLGTNKARLSSGAAAHLVERKAVGGANEIVTWPIGEVSIVAAAGEPRLGTVMPVKSLYPDTLGEAQEVGEKASEVKDANPSEAEPETDEQPTQPIQEMETNETNEAKGFDMDDFMSRLDARLDARDEALKAALTPKQEETEVKSVVEVSAPTIIMNTGDSESKAYAHWVKTGDSGGLRGAKGYAVDGRAIEIKASNAVDMQVGTDAEGGHLVPEGHFNGIMARRDQSSLKSALGLTRIPGKGTTVHVPLDGEADGEFVATNEEGTYDKDTPVIGNQAFTLVKYTKNVPISEELMEDDTSGLLSFIENWIGRGMAKTDNSLIVAELEASATEFKVLTQAGIAAGEIEDMAFNDNVGPYLDGGNVAWVTRASTYGDIASLTGNDRLYAEQVIRSQFGVNRPSLMGYPVFFSDKVDADGTGDNKPIFFGDFSQLGYYEGDGGLTVLRDPYSEAASGQTNLWYRFRIDYEILQSEAIGWGRNSTT